MDKIELAVIDDGINEGLYNTVPLEGNIEITPQLHIYKRIGYNLYTISHGTICAAIIKKYLPDIPLNSIKILNNNSKCIKEQLVKSIDWCVKKGIKLINLSLGSIDYRDFEFIRNAVNEAYKEGLIIVAAYSNQDIITYPASLSNVIGVKCDRKNALQSDEYIYNTIAYDGVEITASGSYTIKNFRGKKYTTAPANSYAAPFITALVYEIMTTFPDIRLEEIKNKLWSHSSNYTKNKQEWNINFYKNIDWVQEAYVFSLGRTDRMLNSNLFFFDTINSIEVNCDDLHNSFYYIKDFVKQTYLKTDTIIIINENVFYEKGDTYLKNELINFINEMEKNKINVVYIDDNTYCPDLGIKSLCLKTKLWYPLIYKFNSSDFMKIESDVEVPVIIVYDFEGKELPGILSFLLNAFKSSGYYAVTAVDSYKGILMGHKPIPVQDTIKENCSNILSSIYHINTLYQPDIIIIGINSKDRISRLLECLDQKIGPDILIFITEKLNNDLKTIKDLNNLKSKIIIYSGDVCDINNYKSGKIFNNLKENSLDEMYNYIISLFENN